MLRKHSLPCRLLFSYEILTPAALNFFVTYADGAVESLWSIDQYFEFVLVLMLSTGLSFQARRLPCTSPPVQQNVVLAVSLMTIRCSVGQADTEPFCSMV